MRFQDRDFPKKIRIEVPRGRQCNIEGQTFSTDDLPHNLLASYEGEEVKKTSFRDIKLVKYSVEPIFSLCMAGKSDYCGNECYNPESMNRLCEIISQPWMSCVRSAIPEDVVITETEEKQYWLYMPNEKYKLAYVRNGKIYSVVIIGCDFGYYYELEICGEERIIHKIGNRTNLSICQPRAVKPIVFLNARIFKKKIKGLITA